MANEIWNILGRDRNAYVSRDVFSDDEDMEADASILEREEKLRFGYRYVLLVFEILRGLPFLFSFQRPYRPTGRFPCIGGGAPPRGRKAKAKERSNDA